MDRGAMPEDFELARGAGKVHENGDCRKDDYPYQE